MYKIKCDDLTLYNPIKKDLVVGDPNLNLEVNKAGSLTFSIYPDHVYYNRLEKMKSILTVYQDNKVLFKGRVFSDTVNFYKVKKIEVEGLLAYFNDTVVRPYSFEGSVLGYLTFLINQHNAQVEEFQRFKIGTVTVEDPNDYIVRSSSATTDARKTWEEIEEKLINTLGGYLCIRYEDNGNYIDYLADYTDVSTQPIKYAVNLLDLENVVKAEELATCLIPYGAEITDEESKTTTRVNITSVNGGLDYIQIDEAVAKYGKIYKIVTWDDVTEPSNLLRKANLYLSEAIKLSNTLTISAVDLHLSNKDVEAFKLGDYIEVYSEPHGINQLMLLRAYNLPLANPTGFVFTLGAESSSFVDSQISSDRHNVDNSNRIETLDKKVENVTSSNKVNVVKVDVYYYLSTSATQIVGGSWTTNPPEWVDGRYYWSKTITTLANGESKESTPVCITGAKGATGNGVASIVEEYYLSTSKTTQSGGSWTTTPPTWSTGKYIWTRSKITYTDSTIKYTTPICDSSWEAVNDIEIGGRNLLLDTKDFKSETCTSVISEEIYNDLSVRHLNLIDATENYMTFAEWKKIYPPKLGQIYTFSFYAKGTGSIRCFFYGATGYLGTKSNVSSQGKITTNSQDGNMDITLTDEWTRYWVTWTLKDSGNITIEKYVLLRLLKGNEAYVCGCKLEYGNKATDWSPAPEDYQTELDKNIEETTNYINQVKDDSAEYSRTLVKDYTKTSDFESYKETVSTSLSQTNDEIVAKFNTVSERITEENGEINRQLNEINKYIRLVDGNIILGEIGNPLTTKISNGRISFLLNETVEVAYISDDKLYITNAEFLNDVIIGNFGFRIRPNGNVSWMKVK